MIVRTCLSILVVFIFNSSKENMLHYKTLQTNVTQEMTFLMKQFALRRVMKLSGYIYTLVEINISALCFSYFI